MGNFNTAFAVMAGLHSSGIYRLKSTWATLYDATKATFTQLEDLFTSARSFVNLRKAIREKDPPCIPYLGIYLTDLTFIEEGGSDYVHPKLINWRRCKLTAGVIREIMQYTFVCCALLLETEDKYLILCAECFHGQPLPVQLRGSTTAAGVPDRPRIRYH
jgi:hypothetical protein